MSLGQWRSGGGLRVSCVGKCMRTVVHRALLPQVPKGGAGRADTHNPLLDALPGLETRGASE